MKEHRDPRLIPPVDLSYLETLESPYLLERDMKDMKNRILYFETSRGCPYQCQYCLSSLEKGLRFFSMDYLIILPVAFFLDLSYNSDS